MSGVVQMGKLSAAEATKIMPVMIAAFDPDYREGWSLAQVESALAIPGTQLVAAMIDDKPSGFALFRTLFDDCEVLLIAVHPAQRCKAIGSALIGQIMTAAKTAAARKLFLEVRITNSAVHFYARHGFNIIGERKHYYTCESGEAVNALTMSVDI